MGKGIGDVMTTSQHAASALEANVHHWTSTIVMTAHVSLSSYCFKRAEGSLRKYFRMWLQFKEFNKDKKNISEASPLTVTPVRSPYTENHQIE